jgi:hypothetical protein
MLTGLSVPGTDSGTSQVKVGLEGAQSRSDFFQKQLEELREVHIASEAEKVDTARLKAEQTAGHGLYSSASIPSGDGQTGR